MDKALIYGCNGYTAGLLIEMAMAKGYRPVLAGRTEHKVREVGMKTGLPFRVFDLSDGQKVAEHLEDFDVVIHCAGPFAHTAKPMAEACLAANCHYLDITGELEVFELLKSMDGKAGEAGVMLMPGAGFDVVPTDCMAAMLKKKLPDANHLELAFCNDGGSISHGTATTMVENLGKGGAIRENGAIKVVKTAYDAKTINFGFDMGDRFCFTIPWGDVSTAHFSTGIPNIMVYTGIPPGSLKWIRLSNYLGWLLRSGPIQRYMKKKVDQRPAGPSAAQRQRARSFIWGKATNAANSSVEGRLKVREGYTLTAECSLLIAEKVLAGNYKAGYQTPSSAYGHGLILEAEGSVFE